jgi:MSHA biogenesis protein MshP
MSLRAAQPCTRSARQAGFSLVAAVFLIVVLAAMGAFAVRVAMSQYQGTNVGLLQARAQAAAEAGIEYGANVVLHQASPIFCKVSPSTRTFALAAGALKGFVVTVTCTPTTHLIYSGGWQAYTVFTLAARASHGTYGGPDYVARSVTRNVTLAPP